MKKYYQILFLIHFLVLLMAERSTTAHPVEKQFFSLKLAFGEHVAEQKQWQGTVDIVDEHQKPAVIRSVELAERFSPDTTEKVWFREGIVYFKGESKKQEAPKWVQKNNSRQPGYDSAIHNYYGIRPFSFFIHLFAEPGSEIFIELQEGESIRFILSTLSLYETTYFADSIVSAQFVYPAMQMTESRISEVQSRYNNYSDVTGTADGATYLSYVAFTEAENERLNQGWVNRLYKTAPADLDDLDRPVVGDQLKLISMLHNGQKQEEAITENGRDLYETRVVVDKDQTIWVFWSENIDDNWDLYYKYKKNGQWSGRMRLTNHENPDIHPEVAVNAKGQLAVVYQSFDANGSAVKYALVNTSTGRATDQGTVYNSKSNEWEPAIASDSKGNFVVVWDTYQHGSYDIILSYLNANGNVSKPQYIAASPAFEANASVDVDQQDRVWVAYEHAGTNWGKDYGDEEVIDAENTEGLNMGRSIRVRCLVDGAIYEPKAAIEKTIPKLTYGMNYYTKFSQPKRYERNTGPEHFLYWPKIKIASDGRVGLVYKLHEDLKGTIKNYTILWDNYITFYNGKSWEKPVLLSGSHSQMIDKVAITTVNERFLLSYSGDLRNNFPKDSINKKMNVHLALVQPEGKAYSQQLELLTKQINPVEVNVKERQNLKTLKNYEVKLNGETYRVYTGDTHRHSSYSADGGLDGSIYDLMRYTMDAAGLDWVNSADHDFGGATAYEWYNTQKLTDVFHVKGYFYPIFGYERSVSFPDGHRNVLFANRGIRMLDRLEYDHTQTSESPDTEMLYRYLHQYDGISIPHTPVSAGTDWRSNDPEVEPVVEIYQGCRESSEYIGAPRNGNHGKEIGSYWTALKKGYRLGVIASSDHHSTHVSYGMVYMQDISRENIMQAMKKRHTYGATDNIILDFSIGDHMMGDEIILGSGEPIQFSIKAIGTDKIDKIDIIKNASEIIPLQFDQRQKVELEWEDEQAEGTLNYYYIRLIQSDGEMAWSSPIWINRNNLKN